MTEKIHTNSEFQCRTCENKDCEYYSIRENMSAGKDLQTGWRASPAVITFAVGCLSHSALKKEPAAPNTIHCDFAILAEKDAEIARLKFENNELDCRLWGNAENTKEEIARLNEKIVKHIQTIKQLADQRNERRIIIEKRDAEIARLKNRCDNYHEAIEVLRESKDQEIAKITAVKDGAMEHVQRQAKEIRRLNETLRTTAHCHGELQREMFKQRDRIAQQDQELKDLGQEIERRGKKIAELWLGSAWDNKPTKEPAQPVPSDTGMAKDIGDLILRVDKLEQAFCNCPVKEFPDFDKRIKECEERTRSYPARNTWILQLEEHERKFNQYETALKSLKEEVAAIPRPPKDRENYYEIDLGPGFQKIYISKNSVYPVPDQDAGGKKE